MVLKLVASSPSETPERRESEPSLTGGRSGRQHRPAGHEGARLGRGRPRAERRPLVAGAPFPPPPCTIGRGRSKERPVAMILASCQKQVRPRGVGAAANRGRPRRTNAAVRAS